MYSLTSLSDVICEFNCDITLEIRVNISDAAFSRPSYAGRLVVVLLRVLFQFSVESKSHSLREMHVCFYSSSRPRSDIKPGCHGHLMSFQARLKIVRKKKVVERLTHVKCLVGNGQECKGHVL